MIVRSVTLIFPQPSVASFIVGLHAPNPIGTDHMEIIPSMSTVLVFGATSSKFADTC